MQQSMPGPVEEEADPFSCDEFGPTMSQGAHGTKADSGFTVPAPAPRHGDLSAMISGRGGTRTRTGRCVPLAGLPVAERRERIEHAEARHARGRERARPPDLATHAGGAHARRARATAPWGPSRFPSRPWTGTAPSCASSPGGTGWRGPAAAVNVQIPTSS